MLVVVSNGSCIYEKSVWKSFARCCFQNSIFIRNNGTRVELTLNKVSVTVAASAIEVSAGGVNVCISTDVTALGVNVSIIGLGVTESVLVIVEAGKVMVTYVVKGAGV